MADHSTAQINWKGTPPSTEVIALVRADIARELTTLSRPSRLIYHIVQLTSERTGPSVVLWGVEDRDGFAAEYHEITDWVSIGELTDGPLHSAIKSRRR